MPVDFDSDLFQEQFHYDGKLGVILAAASTEFKLWAPTAEAVTLYLYPDGGQSAPTAFFPMQKGPKGVWDYAFPHRLDGTYYDYDVTVEGVRLRTADPYAIAAGRNGLRSMVLDLRDTDPEGWESDRPPAKPAEDIIYEIHTRDFTWDPACGIPEEKRGRFAALCQEDSSLNGDCLHPTGLSYLKHLGVTHIQLMPVYDFGSVDESASVFSKESQTSFPTGSGVPESCSPFPEVPDTSGTCSTFPPDASAAFVFPKAITTAHVSFDDFNWGYDPWNYNLPEGSYSTNPADGAVRIRELKEAIACLHRNGFRVIMDVVYNHTYRLDSWLWRTVPGYYYRRKPDGSPSNGSGCGNDLASERSMCAKYILDSVLYWTDEYHMDGFRFDLMGLLDVDLMNRIQDELDARYGPGEKLLYGEPWRAQTTACREGTLLADKEAFSILAPELGAFCDATRDAIKGNLMKEGSVGFVNGGPLDAKVLADCITGWAQSGREFSVRTPAQTISYLSSHDDWTLWDRLVYTLAPQSGFDTFSPRLLAAKRLAAAINCFCQGHLFLLSGEEFARTKQGIRDSVRSPIEVNRLDWTRAWQNQDLIDYYRGLFALRKQLPGLCDKSIHAKARLLSCRLLSDHCAIAMLDNRSHWNTLLLLINTSEAACSVRLPEGCWQLLVDGESSFLWATDADKTPRILSGEVSLAPVSAMYLGQV